MKLRLIELSMVQKLLNDVLVPMNEEGTKRTPNKIPVKTAYWMSKFMKKLTKEIEDYEKNRIDLCIRHSNKDANGVAIQKDDITDTAEKKRKVFDIGDTEAWQKEFNELGNIEIEIPFSSFSLEQFGDIDMSVVHMSELISLGFIEDEDKDDQGYEEPSENVIPMKK
jgi:hypothetical protein